MNCKPNDLAVVIASDNPKAQGCIGKIVRCVRYTVSIFDADAWYVEPTLYNDDDGKPLLYAEDKYLRPLPPLDEHDTTDEKEPILEHA